MEKGIVTMVEALIAQMNERGFARNTIKVYEHTVFAPILRRYEELGVSAYDPCIMDGLAASYESQLKEGKISKALYNWRIRGINLLHDYRATGKLYCGKYSNQKVPEVPEEYQELMNGFLSSLGQEESTKERVMLTVRSFMIFLKERNICEAYSISPEDARCFIEETYEAHKGSMDSVIYAMRLFFQYLESIGVDVKKIMILLSFPMRAKKVKPTFTEDELVKILSSIDRTTAPGKRDFAILSLAASTGIRGIDLISLTLTDILWREKEIHFTQRKTGKSISLPVQKPVLDSIADYILNERPKSELHCLFMTCRVPHHAFSTSSDLDGILNKHMKTADVAHEKGDGKSFHGLRRFIGTEIVSHGGTATIAAEVLGHQGIAATRQYISTDMDGLRKCVLSRSTIGGAS